MTPGPDMPPLMVAVVAAAAFVPTLLAVGTALGYRLWLSRDGRRSPIDGRRLHGAGEQSRKRIDEHGDAIAVALAVLLFLGPYLVAVWALQRVPWGAVRIGFGDWLLLAAFAAGTAWAIARILDRGKARRRCIAALKVELFTTQELNRLMGAGCTVLHDVPAERFKIDHVVIGPRAVYLVETKPVRRPRSTGLQDHCKVAFDGETLHFPDFSSRAAVDEARRQAQWLAAHLREATHLTVPVIATVALPGWWIDATPSSSIAPVRVFNPAGHGANFMADAGSGRTIHPDVAALVAQALVMRYPVTSGG